MVVLLLLLLLLQPLLLLLLLSPLQPLQPQPAGLYIDMCRFVHRFADATVVVLLVLLLMLLLHMLTAPAAPAAAVVYNCRGSLRRAATLVEGINICIYIYI